MYSRARPLSVGLGPRGLEAAARCSPGRSFFGEHTERTRMGTADRCMSDTPKCSNRTGAHIIALGAGLHHDILELVPDRACLVITLIPDLRFPQKMESRPLHHAGGIADGICGMKMVAPKIRSNAATSRRYSFPPRAMPNVSHISVGEWNRMGWLCCGSASVVRNRTVRRSWP